MVDVAQVVLATTQEMSPANFIVPGPVMTVCTLFNKVHRVWRWIRWGNVVKNPDNFLALAAGYGCNHALGGAAVFRFAAVGLLIATRILECIEQFGKLAHSWSKLVSAVNGEYPAPIEEKWCKKPAHVFVSVSTAVWWKYEAKALLFRIQRIAVCILQVGKHIFLLSMRIMDAVETFSLSPETQNEGMNEFFVNSAKWVDKLVMNKELILEGLESNKGLLDKILRGVNSGMTAAELIAKAAEALKAAEGFHHAARGASKTFGVFLFDLGHKWTYEFLYDMGCSSLLPRTFVPSAAPQWAGPDKPKIRYCPEESITIDYIPNTWLMLSQSLGENASRQIGHREGIFFLADAKNLAKPLDNKSVPLYI